MKKIKRILVIRAGNVGDVLMASPVVRKIKKIYPDSSIDFVTSLHAKAVIEGNQYIDNIFFFRKHNKMLRGIRNFFFERNLARNKYDLCIVLEEHPQYHQFARNVMGAYGIKIGFASTPQTNYLDHTVKFNFLEKHAINNGLFLLSNFFKVPIEEDDCLMDFTLPNQVQEALKPFLLSWKGEFGKYFVVHPGCSEFLPLRAWVMPNYSKVIDFLRVQGYRVFLTGSRSDKRFIDEIMKDRDPKDTGVELFLDRHLFDLAFLIEHSSGVISSDTGVMHLARAMRVSVLALFGPSNPDHTGCIGSGEYVQIRNDFKCGPCNHYPQYRLEDKKNCLDGNPPACMRSITVEQVTNGLKKILRSSSHEM